MNSFRDDNPNPRTPIDDLNRRPLPLRAELENSGPVHLLRKTPGGNFAHLRENPGTHDRKTTK